MLGLMVAASLAVGALAGRAVLPPGGATELVGKDVTTEVVERTVGSTLALGASAQLETAIELPARTDGIVTEILVDGAGEISAGTPVVLIEEWPVIVVAGEVPFFRDITEGDEGRDVEQARRWLADAGFEPGEGPGPVDASMVDAISRWQEESDLAVTGTLPLGTLVAVEGLPRRVVIAPDIRVGEPIAPDEPVVRIVGDEPRFAMELTAAQQDLVPLDAGAVIDGRWEAVFGEATTDDAGEVEVELLAPGGGPPCADDCDEIDTVEPTTFPLEVVVVPETTGPAVPISALRSPADGTATLRMDDGEVREVEVLASADGFAVLEGVAAGEVVVVREGGAG